MCARVCAFHILKCVGEVKAGAEGHGALLGVQIYSSVSRGSGRKRLAGSPRRNQCYHLSRGPLRASCPLTL